MSTLAIPGLSFSDQKQLDALLMQLEDKTPRNKIRSDYYDSRYLFKDLGISTPPKFRNFEAVLGWPAKAVDSMSRRCNLDGFVIAGQSAEDLGIDVLWDDNSMEIEAPQAHDSALIHSCAFITTIKGDIASGEPDVLMMVRDAFNATGLWNPRKRGFDAALSVIERHSDNAAEIMYMAMYLPDRVLIMSRDIIGGRWRIDTRTNPLGRVPVEPLVYRPRLGRPFGRSRITRNVMYLTDAAVRTVVRSEIGAEFFTAPQRYGLNIPQEIFEGGGWNAIMGRFLNIEPPTEDENLDPNFKPELGQFPQLSMQPHNDQMRMWASMFASEASLPVGSLGIVQDQPSSAEALYASKEELVIECEAADRGFGEGWVRAVRNALMIRDNQSTVPAEYRKLKAKWRDPATPSRAAAADAVTKDVATFPWMADSEVALEKAGYSRTDIERLMADKRRATASGLVAALSRAPQQTSVPRVDNSINVNPAGLQDPRQ